MANYDQAMLEELNDLDEAMLVALNHIMVQKRRIARAYNKKVKHKIFDEGELIREVILPFGRNNEKYSKWAPNWEGPFIVDKVLHGRGATLGLRR